MPKISDFLSVTTTDATSVIPIVEDGVTKQNKSISLLNLKTQLFTPATSSVLGVVKIGSSLTINDSGLLDVALPLPSLAGNNGKYLTTNGSGLTWATVAGGANTGNFTFTTNDASLPPGNAMTLSTYQSGGNKESKLTLSTSTISSLDVGNNLRIRTGNGTGSEKDWTFGADGSLRFPDNTVFLGTGEITFFGSEIRSVNSHVKLVANSDSVDRKVLQLYTDGTVQIPVSVSSAGIIQSASSVWISANGTYLKLGTNGAIDLPVVNGTTSLIRTPDVDTTINSNGKEWLFSRTGSLTFPIGNVPSSPVEGMFAIADGTNWDPAGDGSKRPMIYLNGTWNFLTIVPITP